MREEEINRIIENVNATMTLENITLLQEDKEKIRECLEKKDSFENAVNELIKKYVQKK